MTLYDMPTPIGISAQQRAAAVAEVRALLYNCYFHEEGLSLRCEVAPTSDELDRRSERLYDELMQYA